MMIYVDKKTKAQKNVEKYMKQWKKVMENANHNRERDKKEGHS